MRTGCRLRLPAGLHAGQMAVEQVGGQVGRRAALGFLGRLQPLGNIGRQNRRSADLFVSGSIVSWRVLSTVVCSTPVNRAEIGAGPEIGAFEVGGAERAPNARAEDSLFGHVVHADRNPQHRGQRDQIAPTWP